MAKPASPHRRCAWPGLGTMARPAENRRALHRQHHLTGGGQLSAAAGFTTAASRGGRIVSSARCYKRCFDLFVTIALFLGQALLRRSRTWFGGRLILGRGRLLASNVYAVGFSDLIPGLPFF